MAIYYSVKTKGFYPDDTDYKTLPDDLIEIDEDKYTEFFNPPSGYHSVFDDQGPRIEQD